jgi:hypothetical protein
MRACSSVEVIGTAERSRRRSTDAAARRPASHRGGVDGNERLTAATAVVLIGLLAAEGVTILFLRPLFSAHVFIGMLLIPPVALKLGSTGWRFARYYRGDRAYVHRGPPLLPLRLLAPLVVAATVAVFGTGVALLVVGPAGGIVLGLHKASFVVWLVATGVHVLAHLRRLPRLGFADWRGTARSVPGGRARRTVLAASIVAGAILAVATVGYAQPWVHWVQGQHHSHDG